MRLQQTKMILYNKRNHQQNEKAIYEWEKIFVNHVSEKRLISGIYEELIGLKEEIKQFNLKMDKRSNYIYFFSEGDFHMAKRQVTNCSTSLLIKEIQIGNTMRYHLIPVRVAILKN